MPIATVNPATGKTEQTFDSHDDKEVEERLALAADAAVTYRQTTFSDRARLVVTAAELLEAEVPDVARIMTTEMGKTFASAKAEASKCAKGLRWFAEHAEALLADEKVDTEATDSRVIWQPMGPVLAVMPWNFPLWQVMRFAAPALMAGNIGLLKHASNVPQTALLIEDLFRRAGFPPGVFQTLLIPASKVAGLIEDPRVRAVTLTGSEEAGRSVAETAGRSIKKSVLELGGSDPFVVLPSADLAEAARVGVTARVQNNGQSCIAAKRFVIHRDCYEAFEEAFVTGMAGLSVGDPMDPASELGPLALASGRDEVAALVDDARDKGAQILCGGTPLDGPGYFYPPTVIADITPDMRVATEEVFGPVALLHRVDNADDALRVANDTGFGLGASVWTHDEGERQRFVEGLDVGMVFVNAMVVSTLELPFGGTKRSGYGRELAGLGIREFCEAKSVWQA
ncbi:MAG TPA: aldehyde dehydrogenase family protein [Acidimicrobiales bacterium]